MGVDLLKLLHWPFDCRFFYEEEKTIVKGGLLEK